ncbi:YbgA family protein [Fictibacillus aquaticus]|uniref:DUF1722 domain-containing protein n=1 Tax=Fictibacillus aquaticus TaxID=2021314 RepID=A0A235F924_9BACL|nr:YbgA family protein [Fictibacillus aquaticus]OYD57447.1 hypothetical protein CGZ90_12275 [Fictibacillus aquaticus]
MKKQAQQLWTIQKYNVMAKGYAHYKEVQGLLREASAEEDFAAVIEKIQYFEQLKYEKKAVINTLEHIWGYFKKQAEVEEKEAFFAALEEYRKNGDDFSSKPPAAPVSALHKLLEKYPSSYLEKSAFLKENLADDKLLCQP